jgi:hypothetical protein
MARRWVGAVLREAEERFHRVQGYQEMPLLIQALGKAADTQEAVTWSRSAVTRLQVEFPRQPGQPLQKSSVTLKIRVSLVQVQDVPPFTTAPQKFPPGPQFFINVIFGCSLFIVY